MTVLVSYDKFTVSLNAETGKSSMSGEFRELPAGGRQLRRYVNWPLSSCPKPASGSRRRRFLSAVTGNECTWQLPCETEWYRARRYGPASLVLLGAGDAGFSFLRSTVGNADEAFCRKTPVPVLRNLRVPWRHTAAGKIRRKKMASHYNHAAIEKKWRENWEKNPINVND